MEILRLPSTQQPHTGVFFPLNDNSNKLEAMGGPFFTKNSHAERVHRIPPPPHNKSVVAPEGEPIPYKLNLRRLDGN